MMLENGNRHGPHGGPLVATQNDIVELSVFETGAPPRFRLYFFDRADCPRGVPASVTVTLETVRPDGTRQTFRFVPRHGFLESEAEIPEPHEFEVALNIAHGGHTSTYRSRFTEERHDHGHAGQNHAHGPGRHHHDHGTGVLGWLRRIFAHSHSAADKIDASMEADARGNWALKVGLLRSMREHVRLLGGVAVRLRPSPA